MLGILGEQPVKLLMTGFLTRQMQVLPWAAAVLNPFRAACGWWVSPELSRLDIY